MSGIKFVSPAVAAGAAEVATVSAKLSEIKTLEKKLKEEMKKSFYKYNGTSDDDNLKVVSFKKGKTTISTSSSPNPDNGKLLYFITIIEKGIN